MTVSGSACSYPGSVASAARSVTCSSVKRISSSGAAYSLMRQRYVPSPDTFAGSKP